MSCVSSHPKTYKTRPWPSIWDILDSIAVPQFPNGIRQQDPVNYSDDDTRPCLIYLNYLISPSSPAWVHQFAPVLYEAGLSSDWCCLEKLEGNLQSSGTPLCSPFDQRRHFCFKLIPIPRRVKSGPNWTRWAGQSWSRTVTFLDSSSCRCFTHGKKIKLRSRYSKSKKLLWFRDKGPCLMESSDNGGDGSNIHIIEIYWIWWYIFLRTYSRRKHLGQ